MFLILILILLLHIHIHILSVIIPGVGGWDERGVDSSVYSGALMNVCQEQVLPLGSSSSSSFSFSSSSSSSSSARPLDLLRTAYKATHSRQILGSSTACVLSVASNTPSPADLVEGADGILETTNVGDSGFLILRRGSTEEENKEYSVVYKSESQQHRFNAPFQLGYDPGTDPAISYSVDVERAECTQHRIKYGDIIVTGTTKLLSKITIRYESVLLRLSHSF